MIKISNNKDLLQKLTSKRKKIDLLDQKMLTLLNQRVRICLEVGNLKHKMGKGIYDSQREREVQRKVEILNKGPLQGSDLRRIFAVIIKACRTYQMRDEPVRKQ
jgi:chorismate mutase / prephenate dehydratase